MVIFGLSVIFGLQTDLGDIYALRVSLGGEGKDVLRLGSVLWIYKPHQIGSNACEPVVNLIPRSVNTCLIIFVSLDLAPFGRGETVTVRGKFYAFLVTVSLNYQDHIRYFLGSHSGGGFA